MSPRAVFFAGAMALPSLVAPAAAQDEDTPAHLLAGIELRPTIAVTTGYDSNPEELPQAEGSTFTRLDLGLRATLGEEGGTQAFINAEGILILFARGEERTQHEYLIEAEVRHPVNEQLTVSAGLSHESEDLTDPATTYSEAWTSVEAEAGRLEAELKGSIAEYRERIDGRVIVAEDLEVYDYRAAAAEMEATADVGQPFKPLLKARVTALDYLEQRPGKPNRDALEHSFMAGAALQVSDTLLVEAGLRRTERQFDQPGAGSHSRISPDVAITWDPNDKLSLTAAYGHFFGEPESEEVLVLDTTFVEVEVAYQADERLRFTGGALVQEEEEIGTGFRNLAWEAFGEARWRLRERLHLLAAARVLHEELGDPEAEGFHRTIVRAGLASTF